MLFKKQVPTEIRYNYSRDALGGVLVGVLLGTVNPFIYFVARDKLHASDNTIGVLMALPFLGMMLAGFYAHFTRTANPIKASFWPLFIGRGLLILMPFSCSALVYTLLISPMLVVGSMVSAPYASIMTQIYPVNVRGKLMAFVRVGMAIVTLVTTQLAGLLLKQGVVSYKLIFAVGGVFSAISALTLLTFKIDPTEAKATPVQKKTGIEFSKSILNILRKDRDYLNYVVGVFVFGFGNILLYTKMPIFQVDVLHITEQQVAILANISTILWMASYPFWGKYIDGKSPVKAAIISIFLTCLIPVNYILSPNPWYLIPSAVVNGVVMAGIELSLFSCLLYFTKSGLLAEYQSTYSIAGGIRGLTAPFCVPLMLAYTRSHNIDFRYLFGVDIVLIALGAVIMWVTLRAHLKHSLLTGISKK